MAKKKILNVLSSAAVGVLLATALGTGVYAKVTDVIVNSNGKDYSYDYTDLKASYVKGSLGIEGAEKLFEDYSSKLKDGNLKAYNDDKNGYIEYAAIRKAAVLQDNFELNTYTESEAAKANTIEVGALAKVSVKDGQIVVGEEEQQDLKVESVSAITDTVDVNGTLQFAINGETKAADLAKVKEAGYTVEFLASADVFGSGVNTSNTGVIDSNETPANAGKTFKYQVKITKEGETIAPSALKDVKVVDESAIVTEISEFKVLLDDIELESGKLELTDSSVTVQAWGKTKDMAADADAVNITTKLDELTSSSNARLSIASNRAVTLNGLTGAVTLTAKAGEITKTLPLTVVDGVRAIKAENSTIDTASLDLATGQTAKVVAMLKDQYGDPIKAEVAIANATNTDGDQIATTTSAVNAVKTGKAELTVTADSTNAGTGKLELKVGTVKIGEVNVKVTAPGDEVAQTLLKLKGDNKATVDMKDATPQTVLNLAQLDEVGLLIGNVTKTDEYVATSSDATIASVAWALGEDITITGQKPGVATITVERTEGALVTETYTFDVEVVDTKAVVTGVTFETEIPKITEAAGIDLAKVVKVAGITVNPDVEIEITATGVINEVIADADNVKIGEIKLTAISADGFSAPTIAASKIAVTAAGAATGYVNVAVVDNYGNLIGEVDVEVAIVAGL